MPLGVPLRTGPRRPGSTPSNRPSNSFLRLTARGNGWRRPSSRSEQGEFVAHEAPAALAEQGAEGRFAGAGMAGHQQRPAVLLDAGGVEQEEALLAERHLQVHAHLGGEQPLRQRQRRRVGEHIIAAYRHRRPKPAPPRPLRLQPDGEVAKPVGLGIAGIELAEAAPRAGATASRFGRPPARPGGGRRASCPPDEPGGFQLGQPGGDGGGGVLGLDLEPFADPPTIAAALGGPAASASRIWGAGGARMWVRPEGR